MQNCYSTPAFEEKYTYTGNDLGAVWRREKTCFRLWAPTADGVWVQLYESGDPEKADFLKKVPLTRDLQGTWVATIEGDLNGVYYTYLVKRGGKTVECCDPYARTTGVNGRRAMVIDLSSTDPQGWELDTDPHAGMPITDAVIGELHIRDLSIDPSGNFRYPGKFLGLTETGTKTNSGIPTGLDHYKNLGITHLHILPMYDFGSVDEAHPEKKQYNWGYDPVNFNVPEGSYATDPFHGEVRVRELKQMVKALHDNGISVVMDVVYNHVFDADSFCFNQIVPQYFSRITDGAYSNGSVCGNDTASERSMVSKYIVDSVCYWAEEYHIDGFRFDLVGLIDTDTINAIISRVHAHHPNVIFYGEGWSMDTQLTKQDVHLCTQLNAREVPEFAFFSDTIRDVLRGSVFDLETPGFVSGAIVDKDTLESCYMGIPFWAPDPRQSVNYVSCHDNNTLIDRITLSTPEAPRDARIRMNNLAAAFSITAQGIPFFQAGEEMLRSKPDGKGGLEHNSYHSSDSVNSIKWDELNDPACMAVCRYYQGLIQFRRAHPQLRLEKRQTVLETVKPIPLDNPHAVAFRIGENIIALFNAGIHGQKISLPAGVWGVTVDADQAGTGVLRTVQGSTCAQAMSALILVKQ